jgi:hypothetical protein
MEPRSSLALVGDMGGDPNFVLRKIRADLDHLARQREKIEWLRAEGKDEAADAAAKLLNALEDTLLQELQRLSHRIN